MPEEAESEDERVLSPDEEVLEDSEYVIGLDDDRYLVSPSKIDPATEEQLTEESPHRGADGPPVESVQGGQPSIDVARGTIQGSLRDHETTYTIELTASIEGSMQSDRIETDDVVEAFERLNRAFARGVADDVPVDEVFDILLAESALGGTVTTHSVQDVIEAVDLKPYDRIADLEKALERLE